MIALINKIIYHFTTSLKPKVQDRILKEFQHFYVEPFSTDNMSDDSNIRRSKRTPVPKRNFKLIDEDFKKAPKEQKQPAKKKEHKIRGTVNLF